MYLRKVVTSITIVAFLLVGATGVAYSGLMMGHDSAVCPMSPLAHINSWQNMFAAIPVQSAVMVLLLLLALFFVSRLKQYLWLLHPSPQPVYLSYDPDVVSHDPVRRFIFRGLTHPKIF